MQNYDIKDPVDKKTAEAEGKCVNPVDRKPL